MDISFACSNCNQALEADETMSGSQIACPSCGTVISVPAASDPAQSATGGTESARGAGFGRKLTIGAAHAPPTASIAKGRSPLEIQAKAGVRVKLKTIRRSDCVMNGHDRFDETVSEFLQGIADNHIISIHPLHYSQMDKASGQPLADYGVMIVYKG